MNDLPQSQRALRTAMGLAQKFNAELATISFAVVVDPTAPIAMKEDCRRIQVELHDRATQLAQEHGICGYQCYRQRARDKLDSPVLMTTRPTFWSSGLHQQDQFLTHALGLRAQ